MQEFQVQYSCPFRIYLFIYLYGETTEFQNKVARGYLITQILDVRN